MLRPKPDRKLEALQECGTANPHADSVRDPAFVFSDFLDRRDLVQVRYEMLRRVGVGGQSVAEVAACFGVSRQTFYKLQDDFNRHGITGLLPGKRGPRRPRRKVTDEVMHFIEETAAVQGRLGTAAVAERVHRRFGLVLSRATVRRALARSTRKGPRRDRDASESRGQG